MNQTVIDSSDAALFSSKRRAIAGLAVSSLLLVWILASVFVHPLPHEVSDRASAPLLPGADIPPSVAGVICPRLRQLPLGENPMAVVQPCGACFLARRERREACPRAPQPFPLGWSRRKSTSGCFSLPSRPSSKTTKCRPIDMSCCTRKRSCRPMIPFGSSSGLAPNVAACEPLRPICRRNSNRGEYFSEHGSIDCESRPQERGQS